MVLIKIIELVVDVDGLGYVAVDVNDLQASILQTAVIVLLDNTLDSLAHHVERDAQRKEDQAKDAEYDHGGAEGWDGSPGRKHLLLELALLQFFYLFLNADEVFFCDFHFCNDNVSLVSKNIQ